MHLVMNKDTFCAGTAILSWKNRSLFVLIAHKLFLTAKYALQIRNVQYAKMATIRRKYTKKMVLIVQYASKNIVVCKALVIFALVCLPMKKVFILWTV